MKIVLIFLLLSTLFSACKDKELSGKYLSHLIVVRQPDNKQKIVQAQPDTLPQLSQSAPTPSKITPPVPVTKYHIIVASFKATDKAAAEKLTEQLKAQQHPATLLTSSERFRVSIASFPSEAEANKAREKYCDIMKRTDLWVFKTK